MDAEVGALGEVLAQKAVGVLVRAALPGALRIAKVDCGVGRQGTPVGWFQRRSTSGCFGDRVEPSLNRTSHKIQSGTLALEPLASELEFDFDRDRQGPFLYGWTRPHIITQQARSNADDMACSNEGRIESAWRAADIGHSPARRVLELETGYWPSVLQYWRADIYSSQTPISNVWTAW